MKIKTALFFLMFLFSLVHLQAQAFHEYLQWSYSGRLIVLASDNGRQGADPMQIVPSLGFSTGYPIFDFLSVELTEDIYFSNYEFNFEKGYPMACTPDNRKAFVIGFTTGFQAAGAFPISEKGILVRATLGITADLRLVLQAFGLHPDDATTAKRHTSAISNYFWSNGRFLFLPVGAGMDFPINEKYYLGFDLRVWYPLYRLWTDSQIPFIDGWRFGIGLRITPRKDRRQRQPQPSEQTDIATD